MRKLRQTGPSPPPSWLCQASLGGGGALPTLGKGRYQREGARASQVAWGDEPLRRRRGTSLCARPPASPPPSSHPKLSPSFGPHCVQAWGLGGPPRAASCSGPGSQGRGCLGQGLGAAGGTCVSGVGMSLDPPDSRSPHPPPAGPSAGREPPVGGGRDADQACAHWHPAAHDSARSLCPGRETEATRGSLWTRCGPELGSVVSTHAGPQRGRGGPRQRRSGVINPCPDGEGVRGAAGGGVWAHP